MNKNKKTRQLLKERKSFSIEFGENNDNKLGKPSKILLLQKMVETKILYMSLLSQNNLKKI